MGLSASQARLLSITARLSDNELHSQSIANAKVRLADKTQDASKKYINTLNAQKLVFTTYDAKGTSTMQNLTPAFLYQYTPRKNQYVMQDTNGIYLLSAEDIKNFEETDSLMKFLAQYDLFSLDMYEQAMRDYQEDLKNYNEKKGYYDDAYTKYQDDLATYNSQKAEYDADHKRWQAEKDKYDADYQKYLDELSEPSLYDVFSNAVGTSDMKDGPEPTDDMSKMCYWHALQANDQNSCSCYAHVLRHLLDYNGSDNTTGNNENGGYYTTTTGDTIGISGSPGGYMNGTCQSEMDEVSKAINEKDKNGNYKRFCDGTDDYQGISGVKNKVAKAKEDLAAGTITELQYKIQCLLSDFVDNGDGTYSIKTLKQKAIDLLYLSSNWGPALSDSNPNSGLFPESALSREEMVDMLINFTDGDMRNLATPPTPPDPFTMVEPTPPEVPVEPVEPKKPDIFTKLADQDKAQWYVNLWYMMNGSDTANLVKEDGTTDYKGVFVVPSVEKNKNAKVTYKELDENLMKSEAWIQFALEHGIVTLVRAQYINPSEDSGKFIEITSEGITWEPTVWSSCVDISSVDDEAAIAKAEAEYNHKLNEIEVKDKKYDNEIKKLDTEHNALQTEFDSIKEIINKNEERSFKAFS